MDLKQISELRITNTYDGEIHESIFRSYHLLDKVIQMIERGDSKKTIFEIIDFIDSQRVFKALINEPTD